MKKQEQARIILEEVDAEYSIPSYMEKNVIRGIMAGLAKIESEDGNIEDYERRKA